MLNAGLISNDEIVEIVEPLNRKTLEHREGIYFYKELPLVCPCCKNPVIPKNGKIVPWHWSHRSGECPFVSEPETPWHLDWKKTLPTSHRELTIRHRGELHRLDGLSLSGIPIEFQHSQIKVEEIESRNEAYKKGNKYSKGVFTADLFWILDAKKAELKKMGRFYPYGDHLLAKDCFLISKATGLNELGAHYYTWSNPVKAFLGVMSRGRLFLDIGEEKILHVLKYKWFGKENFKIVAYEITKDFLKKDLLLNQAIPQVAKNLTAFQNHCIFPRITVTNSESERLEKLANFIEQMKREEIPVTSLERADEWKGALSLSWKIHPAKLGAMTQKIENLWGDGPVRHSNALLRDASDKVCDFGDATYNEDACRVCSSENPGSFCDQCKEIVCGECLVLAEGITLKNGDYRAFREKESFCSTCHRELQQSKSRLRIKRSELAHFFYFSHEEEINDTAPYIDV